MSCPECDGPAVRHEDTLMGHWTIEQPVLLAWCANGHEWAVR